MNSSVKSYFLKKKSDIHFFVSILAGRHKDFLRDIESDE